MVLNESFGGARWGSVEDGRSSFSCLISGGLGFGSHCRARMESLASMGVKILRDFEGAGLGML